MKSAGNTFSNTLFLTHSIIS